MNRRARILARSAIAVIAVVLAVEIITTGVAMAVVDSNPALAAQFAPGNARVSAAAARTAVARHHDLRSPAVNRLVGVALARDITIPAAIEFRALRYETEGYTSRAKRLFNLSDAISRRSLPTRLWLIEQSVDRGDVAGALRNFDVALRTSTDAPKILFPVLARAASDPSLVTPIARLLDRPSDWRVMFLNYAINEGNAAPDIAHVVLEMYDKRAIRAGQVDRTLIARLEGERQVELAQRVRRKFVGREIASQFR